MSSSTAATQCSPQTQAIYSNKLNFDTWKATQVEPSLNAAASYANGSLGQDLRERPTGADQRLTTFRDSFFNVERLVSQLRNCLLDDLKARTEFSGQIYTLQQEIEEKRKTLKEKELTVQEAKERASNLENPYANYNPKESWFPLGRPLQKQTAPVLLSIAMAILVIAILLFVRLILVAFPALASAIGFSEESLSFMEQG